MSFEGAQPRPQTLHVIFSHIKESQVKTSSRSGLPSLLASAANEGSRQQRLLGPPTQDRFCRVRSEPLAGAAPVSLQQHPHTQAPPGASWKGRVLFLAREAAGFRLFLLRARRCSLACRFN